MCAMCVEPVTVWRRDCDGWRNAQSGEQLDDKTVANTPDGDNFVAERAEFLAQARDVGVHGALESVVLVAPDTLNQELAAERAARMLDKELEQFKFLGSEV